MLAPILQVYTVAKDGALCVWECSASLSEMTALVEKSRQLKGRTVEGVESGGDKDGKEDEVVNDSDSEDVVAMETEATLPGKAESSDDGTCTSSSC